MRLSVGLAAFAVFALAVLAGVRSQGTILPERTPSRIPRTKTVPIAAVVSKPATPENIPPAQSSETLSRLFTFDPSKPLLEPLITELSIPYIGRGPNVAAALEPRREEGGIALATIVRDPNCNRKARYRALYLISEMGFPQAREVLLSVIDDVDLKAEVVRLLGKRQDPGNADVLLRLYASDGKARPGRGATILEALTTLGDARVLPLLDEQMARVPNEKLWFLEAGIDPARVEEMLQFSLDRLLNQRKLVELANARDPVAATVPLLYESSFPDRVWAIHFLERLNPPALPAHLRASYEISKSRGKNRSDPYFYEHELLTVLSRSGGTLTPSERAYLTAWDNMVGCITPPLPD